jgi:hypothetical protein
MVEKIDVGDIVSWDEGTHFEVLAVNADNGHPTDLIALKSQLLYHRASGYNFLPITIKKKTLTPFDRMINDVSVV